MEKVFTPEETAELLRVKVRTVLEWLRDGTLRGVKLGRATNAQWRIPESAIEEFIVPGRPDQEGEK